MESGNEPGLAEIDYISAYIDTQLSFFESLSLDSGRQSDQLPAIIRAITIDSAINDLLSPDGGNYKGLIDALNKRVSLQERLEGFLRKAFCLLDNSELQLFSPKNISERLVHEPNYGYKAFDLDEYLTHLEKTPPVTEVPVFLQSPNAWQQFADAMNLLLEYLSYLVSFPEPDSKSTSIKVKKREDKNELSFGFEKRYLIFFIRDTLLLYLGAKHLQSAGMAIDARAAMISRGLIQSFTPTLSKNPIYAQLYNCIYECLSMYKAIYSRDFVTLYASVIQLSKSQAEVELLQFLKHYLNRLCGKQSGFLAVDNASHGTMPLLAMTASSAIKEFRLYSGVPWLQEFYREVIYKPDFPHMRMLETFVCQEELFRFAGISGDRIIVEETCDPVVKNHAAFEINYFIRLVNSKFLK